MESRTLTTVCQDRGMEQLEEEALDALQRAARAAIRGWSPTKASMALRAAGLDGRERASLDSIAADSGVSRETVRRARNELLAVLDVQTRDLNSAPLDSHLAPSGPAPDGTQATARALRRLLTMTGPLAWDEILIAWARAGGKPPYTPLPKDVRSMRRWMESVDGLVVSAEEGMSGPVSIDVARAEELDQVGQFLCDALRGHSGGVDRADLLAMAEGAGLKPTTIATALSQHPAAIRLGRGTWALRGRNDPVQRGSDTLLTRRKARRPRPTTFSWGSDGSLDIEFSVPRGPSPVVAVPKAVAQFVEGREFTVEDVDRPVRISIGNARLWGFGPLVSESGLSAGQRARISLRLIASTAMFQDAEPKGG